MTTTTVNSAWLKRISDELRAATDAGDAWLDESLFSSGSLMVVDALGNGIDAVETARVTPDGVEVIAVAVTPDGDELVSSHDGGVTFDAVRARMEIPGGQLLDMREKDDG